MPIFKDKVVVITGGTGSLGKTLVRRLLSRTEDKPRKVIIFSRDEAKQHFMRVAYLHSAKATDEVIYDNFRRILEFRIGDVRDYPSVRSLVTGADLVINAAALKQVPSCEYFPYEAVRTNIGGAENLARAIKETGSHVHTAVAVSTDKACKPINVMGMSKSIQERVFIAANINSPSTRFIGVRYGNVLASRGSVIPLFHSQIESGGPVTVTTSAMTRFLLPLEGAVDTIMAALEGANPGEIYVPRIPSALVMNIAKALIADRGLEIKVTGIRPGEKEHEIMISAEEAINSEKRGDYYVIRPMLPELDSGKTRGAALAGEYSSGGDVLSLDATRQLLEKHQLLVGQRGLAAEEELLA